MSEDTKPEIDTLEKDERDSADFWKRWIKAAKKAAETHWINARDAWAEYEKKPFASDTKREADRCYPIYWSSCKVLEPAYYSRTPKITTRRRFDIKDEIAMTGSLIAERLGQYLIDCSEFDAVMQAAVQDFIHADKTTVQLLYQQDETKTEERVPLVPQGEEFFDEAGAAYGEEVFQDATGYFGKRINATPVNQRITVGSLPFDEVLHTPDAKSEAEVREKAYQFYMTREEAEKRFPGKEIAWKNKKDGGKSVDEIGGEERVEEAIGEYVKGWECWSKPNRKVYWISDQYTEGFLDEKPDPYHLRDFFPSPPFIIGSKPSKNLYPTPAYIQLLEQIDELHTASARIRRLIKAIRRRALVAGDVVLCDLLENADETEFVAAEQLLQKVLEKGGVDQLIFYIPVGELVTAITELITLKDRFKVEFDEFFGIPPVLKGLQPANEQTALESRVTAAGADDRFKWQKKQIQQMARDAIEMMVDLALGVFPDEKIQEYTGYNYMSPEDQQRFPAALAMLRNDAARMIRLEIESDSMSFVDEQLRAQQVNAAVQTMTAGLKEVSQMMEISPQAAAVGLQALLLSLDTMPAGKDFHDEVKQTVQALIDEAKKPKEPPPPPPDYEAMKIQVQQAKVDADNMKAQMGMQAQMRDLDRKDYELQLKAGTDQAKVQLDQYKAQLEQVMQDFMMQLESQRVQLEQFKAQVQARESEMEEIRLAREVDVKAYQAAADSAKQTEPESAVPPVVNIINTTSPEPPATPILPIMGL